MDARSLYTLEKIVRASRERIGWVVGGKSGSAAVMQTIIARTFVIGINLFNGIFTARHLGAEGRGAQAAIALWPQFLCFVLTFGIPFGVRYHARKHQRSRNSLLSSGLVLSGAFGLLATAVGIIFIPTWLHRYGPETVRDGQLLMLFAPQIMLGLIQSSAFEVVFDFGSANVLRYAPSVLTLFGLLAVAALHRFTPFAAALTYAVSSALVSFALIPRMVREFTFTLRDFKRSTRRLLNYGLRIYGSDLLGTFGTQVDQLLVVGLLTSSSLGLYAVALSASRVLNVFQTSLSFVLLPKAAGLATANVVHLVGRAARLTTAMTAISGLALIAIMPFLLPGLYGRDFVAAVVVSQILTVESVLASTTGVLIQSFMATNRPGVATLLQGLGLGIAVPLMFILIPRFGLVGAAFGLLCSTTSRLIIALVCYPMLLHVSAPKLLLARADVRYLIEALRHRSAEVKATP